MMFQYGSGWSFWQVALMWVGMLAFWGLLIWGVYVLVTGATGNHVPRDRGREARHILDQRLARGEIDAAEYRRVRDLITNDHRTPAGTGNRR